MLITRLGFERLLHCEVVVYDRLIPVSLLDHVPSECEQIDVGKIPGHAKVGQDEINRILVDRALAGRSVVRLKGGDPVVFGRVGEEASALAAAGIPFEIIPGVTAASAAAAVAGIPLTHRGIASSVTLATVHEDPSKLDSLHDWEALARGGTLAFYMPGGRTLEAGAKLIEAGLPPGCPVAVVQAAAMPNEGFHRCTLEALAKGEGIPEKGIPFVLLIGEVANLSTPVHRRRPLLGRTIVLTHPASRESDACRERLPLLGAEILECPAIDVIPPEDPKPLRDCLQKLPDYAWILFTSKHAVEAVFEELRLMGRDGRSFGACQIGVAGSATARRLEEYGILADLIPQESSGRGLAKALIERGSLQGKRFLFPASEIAREELPEKLSAEGGAVDRVTAYRTVTFQGEWPFHDRVLSGKVDALCFASPSAVTGFREKVGMEGFERLFSDSTVFSIGPTTSTALRHLGAKTLREAGVASFAGLVEALLAEFGASEESHG
jgi:uroporphyrinogen III methyltransferase/synthase